MVKGLVDHRPLALAARTAAAGTAGTGLEAAATAAAVGRRIVPATALGTAPATAATAAALVAARAAVIAART
jgi:hypothetical protein